MVNGVNLDKTGEFSLFRGVEGMDGDEVFEEFAWFGETFALEGEGAIDGGRTDGQEFFPDGRGNGEGGPGGDEGHLPADEGARSFPHLYQKKAQMRRRESMTSSV
jgi:hypothetical protein